MKILVIGAGWYGCHLSFVLKKDGHEITLVDRTNNFFSGASSKNQNRLHLGFHYPRALKTIEECLKGYPRFLKLYGEVTEDISNNIYFIIPQTSFVSFNNYINVYKDQSYKLIHTCLLQIPVINTEPYGIIVNEKYINPEKSFNFFKDHLIITPLYDCFSSIDQIQGQFESPFDLILNCTYNQLEPIMYEDYELFLTLLYEIDTPEVFAYTFMDGPFFSIYPYKLEERLYTITHVKHCVLYKGHCLLESDVSFLESIKERKNLIESEIMNYLPSWDKIVTYKGYYTSWKTKHNNISDDRSLKFEKRDNILSFYGGKITGIFEAENIVRSVIDEKITK